MDPHEINLIRDIISRRNGLDWLEPHYASLGNLLAAKVPQLLDVIEELQRALAKESP